MSQTFKNPANGHCVTIGLKTVILGMLLGPIYYKTEGIKPAVFLTFFFGIPAILLGAYIGSFLGTLPAAIAGAVIAWAGWSYAMSRLFCTHYLRKGWVRVEA